MKTCALCDEAISTQEIRQGSAISRGTEVYHRDCHRAIRVESPGAKTSAPAATSGTSYPDITHAAEYAGFWRRLGAHVIDGFVLNVAVMAITFPIGMFMGIGGIEASMSTFIGGTIGLILPLAYFIWFWSKKGATPGKLALGVAVVAANGGRPTGVQSLIRYLGYIPSSLFFCLGFLWMLWDDEKRTWHDMLAGTHVMRV